MSVALKIVHVDLLLLLWKGVCNLFLDHTEEKRNDSDPFSGYFLKESLD